jgi:hypothetical protein
MRLLLDECVPRPLKRDLLGHDAHTVGEMGWSSKRNSELLQLMLAQKFECLLTVDQNMEFQQNISGSGIAVVVIAARTNRLKELQPLVPRLLDALTGISAGEIVRVGPLTTEKQEHRGNL